ncbi:MAG: hypothetical protein J3T61_09950 [Candidatus Brocadiales bacterium]|nr:hypothetical protein [Candidatus Bathyanammoxibius sp.]
MANLERIYIRAKGIDKRWGNYTLAEVSDTTFEEWAVSKAQISGDAQGWSLEDRSHFVDWLKDQGMTIVEVTL